MPDPAADDATAIQARLIQLAYDRLAAQVIPRCAAMNGGERGACELCNDPPQTCLVCANTHNVRFQDCHYCPQPGGSSQPCPKPGV